MDGKDWEEIDEKRRRRRQSRAQGRKTGNNVAANWWGFHIKTYVFICLHLFVCCCRLGSDGDQGEDEPDSRSVTAAPFLPRCHIVSCTSSLRFQDTERPEPGLPSESDICCRVATFPLATPLSPRARVTPGVVRWLGPDDQVGVELRERLGDCAGAKGGKQHFTW